MNVAMATATQMPDVSKSHLPKSELLIFTLVCLRLALLRVWGSSNINIYKKLRPILKFVTYILRLTHETKKARVKFLRSTQIS